MHTHDNVHQTHELTCVIGHANAVSHNWNSQLEGLYVGDLLYTGRQHCCTDKNEGCSCIFNMQNSVISPLVQLLSCVWLCDPMDCSTPCLPVHHQLPEPAQTHVHWVSDVIQPSHPLSSAGTSTGDPTHDKVMRKSLAGKAGSGLEGLPDPTHDKVMRKNLMGKADQDSKGSPRSAWASTPESKSVCLVFAILYSWY